MRRLLWTSLIIPFLLTSCGQEETPADLLQSGRRHVEASDCAGVDRYAEAVADLEAALAAGPDQPETYYWLYVAYSNSANEEGATRTLADLEAAASAKSSPEWQFWLFQAYGEKGDDQAQAGTLTALETAAQENPGDAETHFWLARAYYEMERYDQALSSFQSALTTNPEHKLAHFWLGQLYTEQDRFDLALQEFDTVLRLDPENTAAYHNRGAVSYQLGNLTQALTDLQAALERDTDDPRTHYQLGAVYLAQAVPEGQGLLAPPDPQLLEQSNSEFETALALCPGMPEPLIGLGNLYLLQGDTAKALESLNQAADQEPDAPEVWFALAQAHAAMGQAEAACDALDRFMDLPSPPEWQEQAEQTRAQLGCP